MKNYLTKAFILGAFFLVSMGLELQAQTTTTINFDTTAHWTAGSGSLSSYQSDHSYTEGVFSASTNFDALRQSSAIQDGFSGAVGVFAWRLRNSGTGAWTATIASGGVSTFSISIRRWDDAPNPNYTLDFSTNGGTSWTPVASINNTSLSNSSAFTTFGGTINSTNANILIRVNRVGGERIMIDDFVWTDMLTPTPVLYSEMGVFKNANTNVVHWQTSSEKNCQSFNVLRSSDGTHYASLGNLVSKAAFGNSDRQLDYSFTDTNPISGMNYYRVEQLDIDKKKYLSKVLQIIVDKSGSSVIAYPNPATDILNIDFSTSKVSQTEIKLLDMSGRVIKSVIAQTVKGVNNIQLDLGDIAIGIYGIQVFENNKLSYVGKIRKN